MNEFGIPSHEPLRKVIAAFFREQAKVAIDQAGLLIAPVKADPMIDWDSYELGERELLKRITPVITGVWDDSGQDRTGKLNKIRALGGLDPNRWKVEDPNLRKQIQLSTQELAASTFATTNRSIDEARQGVRDAIAGGMDSGRGVSEIKRSLREVFTGATRNRAEAIARTEVSRAYHSAAHASDLESGVVVGYEWEVSSDACPVCLDLAAKNPRVEIGGLFGVVGSHPTYSQVKFPPAHTRCGCSVTPILHPTFGGPNLGWDLSDFEDRHNYSELISLDKLRAVARDAATAILSEGVVGNAAKSLESQIKASRKVIEKAERDQLAASGGSDVIEPGPIGDRINKYTVGDAKIEALEKLGQGLESEAKALQVRRNDLTAELKSLLDAGEALIPKTLFRDRTQKIAEELDSIRDGISAHENRKAKTLASLLKVRDPLKIKVKDFTGNYKGTDFVGVSRSKTDRDTVIRATDFLHAVTKNDGGLPVEARFGVKKGIRAFQSSKGDFIGIKEKEDFATVLHEYGHLLDDKVKVSGNSNLNLRSQEFLRHRVGSEPLRSLKDQFPNGAYADNETGRKDRFDQAFGNSGWYVGKDYGASGTEITSMGIEKLFDDPVGFATKDKEYCKYILGLLDGSLR